MKETMMKPMIDLPWVQATTYHDPHQKVRCGDQVTYQMCSSNRRPRGNFDICLNYLKDQFQWMVPFAEKYCDQGLLSIYYRRHLRFTELAAFQAAYEDDPDAAMPMPELPTQYRFGHTYIFLVDEEEMRRLGNGAASEG